MIKLKFLYNIVYIAKNTFSSLENYKQNIKYSNLIYDIKKSLIFPN